MGIFIHLSISKSVTKEEWADVYEETLRLVDAFPLAETRKVTVRGVQTSCLVPTKEREEVYGWYDEKTRTGWFADGDYESLRRAETYFLLRDVDWDKIFGDIMDDPGSFERYYPMVRVKITADNVLYLVRAIVVNDDFYQYICSLEPGAANSDI